MIRDKKAHGDLNIINHSENWAPVEGGKKILLFTEKISRDDIEVHFLLDDGKLFYTVMENEDHTPKKRH